MEIIGKVNEALQYLFGPCAEQAGQTSGVIIRQRKFTALSLARTFVLGFLRNPEASAEELAQVAVQCGAEVTPQAIDQRLNALESKYAPRAQTAYCTPSRGSMLSNSTPPRSSPRCRCSAAP